MVSVFINDRLNDFDLDEALATLPEQRREQALKFKYEMGRRTCVAAYQLLCQALLSLYGIKEKPLFEYGPHGKPTIMGQPDIHFNLSHCREAAICIVSDHPVGVDIETPGHYKEAVARYAMNDVELQTILQAEQPDIAFTRLWTMKEAVVKRAGTGIFNNMKEVLTDTSGLITVQSPDLRYIYSIAP